jgi:2-dehydropantoate 2-reductase
LSGRTSTTASLHATSSPASLGGKVFDTILVLVKSQATVAAFEALQPHLSGEPVLLTLQNGMGNVEALAERCAWDIAQGVSMEAGRLVAPGEIEHFLHGEESWIGPVRGSLARVELIGEILNEAGMPTRVTADPRGAVWSKFIFNCVMNPVGAILRGDNRARYEVAQVRDLIDAMFAQGIRLQFDPMHLVKKVRGGELPLTRHAGSMATDLAAGRETELEALTGYLVRTARALGLDVPVAETVYGLAKGVEYAVLHSSKRL